MFVKTKESHITFSSLDLSSTQVIIYLDRSFNNLPDEHSQGGYTTMVTYKNQKDLVQFHENQTR